MSSTILLTKLNQSLLPDEVRNSLSWVPEHHLKLEHPCQALPKSKALLCMMTRQLLLQSFAGD
jgi:hypothetical protein